MNEQLMQEAGRLHKAGQLDEAATLYRQIVEADPGHFVAQTSLGFVYMLQNRFAEAERHLSAAVNVQPRIFEAWVQLSSALHRQGRLREAVNCLDRALGLEPGHVESLTNRAAILLELGRVPQALATAETALTFSPDFVPALVNRGNALSGLKRLDEALASYAAALNIDPDNQMARDNRDNALFVLGRTSRCPPAFMRRLFDEFSSQYDPYMLDTLQYRAHLHLRDLANKVLPPKAALKVLDLGSGTGLVGKAFKDLARGGVLTGIDLSPLMNEEARKLGIYDELILGDLEPYLSSRGTSFDLILAADTMIYLGDLAPTFGGVAYRLVPGGHYIFAVEGKDASGDGGWEQTADNRFRHSLNYLREEAKRQGLEFVDAVECVLRTQDGVPVAGYAVALKKPGLVRI
jgi:predicted TPR repeat methyltransferase